MRIQNRYLVRAIGSFLLLLLLSSCGGSSEREEVSLSEMAAPDLAQSDPEMLVSQRSHFLPCEPSSFGTDYSVGPNQPYENIHDVPWDRLTAGDTVRIFYRPTPYKEKIVIRTSGTLEHPIRICGVASDSGQRPVLDGDGAVNRLDDAEAYGRYEPMEGLAMIMVYNRDYNLKDSHIIIDGLHIKNTKSNFSYTRINGSLDTYEEGAACIRIQAGDNIIIRNNELENCGNGIFTMSQGYNEAHLTRHILIEGNYLHHHGQPGSNRYHSLYIQAIGAVYQYNYFGPNAPGSQGTTLKERVAGSVIRYNWFDSGSARSLDLVEVEDAAPWYIEAEYRAWASAEGVEIDLQRLQKVQEAERAYRSTLVYGNFFNHIGSETIAGSLVHYGWDNDILLSREGTLYFYHNTVLILEDRKDNWRFRLFDLRQTDDGSHRSKEIVEVFNNVVYFASETPGEEASYLCLSNNSGTINLGKNWMTRQWSTEESKLGCYHSLEDRPTVNGLDNLVDITDSSMPIDLATLLPEAVSSIAGQAMALPESVSDHPVTQQYVQHLGFKQREYSDDFGAAMLPRD